MCNNVNSKGEYKDGFASCNNTPRNPTLYCAETYSTAII